MKEQRPSIVHAVAAGVLLAAGVAFNAAVVAAVFDFDGFSPLSPWVGAAFDATLVFLAGAGGALAVATLALYGAGLNPRLARRPRSRVFITFVPLGLFLGIATAYTTAELASIDQSIVLHASLALAGGAMLPSLALAAEALCGRGLLFLGRKADDAGRPGAALALLRWALRLRPSDRVAVRRAGLLLFDAGRLEEARQALESLGPVETSEDVETIRALEEIHQKADRKAECWACLKRYRELKPDAAATDRSYLDLCLALGKDEESIAMLESGRIKMDMEMLGVLQRLYTKAGNFAQAMARARQVAEMESAPYRRAIALYRDLVAGLPDNVETIVNLGELLQKTDEAEAMEEGAALLERALERDPSRVQLRRDLGWYFLRTLQHERAELQYRRLVDEADLDPKSYLRYADLLKAEDRMQDACAVYAQMREFCDDDWRGFALQAPLLLDLDRLDEAESALDGAERLAPDEEKGELNSLRRRIAERREEKSLEALREELDRDGSDLEKRLEFIRQLLLSDRGDRAIVECDAVIEEDPAALGRIEGLLESVLPELEHAFRIRDYLCDLYFRQARFDDMLLMHRQMAVHALEPGRVLEEGCRRILSRAPNHLDARIALSEVYLREGKWAKVLTNYEKLIENPPAEEALRIRAQWTEAAYHAGRIERAAEQGLAILPEMSDDATFLLLMIRILEDLGDYERAYAVFQGAFERFPDHPELLKMERTVADQSKRGRMAALQEREAEDRLTTKEHYEKAELHRQFGQAKQAIVHYQRASEEAGLHDLSIAKMAVCLCERRMFELADETLDPIELSKDRAAMHRDLKGLFYRVAQVFEEENYRNQSVKYYKRIFRIDASYRDVVRKLEKLER